MDIHPIARRLAEANGIDWQQLRGTGDGGAVTEQDIVNHLQEVQPGKKVVSRPEAPLPSVVQLGDSENGLGRLFRSLFGRRD